ADKLARHNPDGSHVPLQIGDVLELNDHRAVVVGLCRVSRTFQSQPVVYTTYSRATTFAPRERKRLSFVLVKAKPGVDVHALSATIRRTTGLAAYTRDGFADMTVQYFLKNTGIPINFGIAVTLGFIVGTAIAGQTFYNFTLDNLRHFGALKAMGTSTGTLLRMILLQAALVGSTGYGLGVGLASLFGYLLRNSELAFRMPWQLLVLSAGAVTLICMGSALLSMHKVMRLEPAIVFKG
ncbi:MAG: FtsX-like permease family protein, partial [Candidatus Tectomicrobia bacterium]|nr:FtsX-like permease family protein [Candidatus Tectomicrobia bacterium]